MTDSKANQISACKAAIHRGDTLEQLRMKFPARAIQIAYGKDPENIDPMGTNNGPVVYNEH